MFDRFTDRTRKVMGYAREQADRLKHDYIGTEHILLGLVQEGSGVAANVLENLDVDLDKVRAEVERKVKESPEAGTMGQLPFTEGAKKVLDYAIEEAKFLKHKYIGTEHLLLGLLREVECMAAEVLTSLGVKLGDVRREVMELLGGAPEHTSVEAVQAPAERIEELEKEKLAAVGAQDFERAARLRDEAEKLRERMFMGFFSAASARVRTALEYAQEEARRDGCAGVDIEHLRRGIERVEKEENS